MFYDKGVITTQVFACALPKETADTLNRESGRIYTTTLVEHYRVYRHTGHWLSPKADERLNDFLSGPTLLHAHSRDAAQQAFAKACKTARACQTAGLNTRYPYKRKGWRSTIWKSTGIRKQGDVLRLALARGNEPVTTLLPPQLRALPNTAFVEM